MKPTELRRIQGFIWNIAADVLRDIYSLGKYRDVIPPTTVLLSLRGIRDEALKVEGCAEALLKKIVGAGA